LQAIVQKLFSQVEDMQKGVLEMALMLYSRKTLLQECNDRHEIHDLHESKGAYEIIDTLRNQVTTPETNKTHETNEAHATTKPMEPLKPMSTGIITRTIETYAADAKPKAQLEPMGTMNSNARNDTNYIQRNN